MPPSSEKPPYRVPSVADTRSQPPGELRSVSTFSGAGGSCYGLEMAGFQTLLACEFVPQQADTYEANHPAPVVRLDIRDVTASDLLALAGVEVGELDLLEGSPPCQPFSTSGPNVKTWGTARDESGRGGREDLFFDFVRLLGEMKPRAFLAENVSGLVRGAAKGYFKKIHAALAEQGYRVEARMLDAQWLGVPQVRRRVIFVGVRLDLELAPAFPDPLPYRYTIRDALPWIERVGYDGGQSRPGSNWGRRQTVYGDEPVPTIEAYGIFGDTPNGVGKYWVESRKIRHREDVGDLVAADIDGYAIADEWDRLAPGQTSDRYFNLVKPDPDQPIPTVTSVGAGGAEDVFAPGGIASVTHPTERRKFTIAELRCLCGFPDDYVLLGSYAQRWGSLGNAVPPPMMFHVGRALAEKVLLA